jgi:hypothetical protein
MTIVERKAWLSRHEGTVKLLSAVCVGYGHPNLDETHDFLTNFGLVESHRSQAADGATTVFYRGYGVQPVIYISKQTATRQFLGVFFEAASEVDLEKATRLPGAGKIEKWECGGRVVQIIDPAGGKFHVVHGMRKRKFSPRVGEVQLINYTSAVDDDPLAKPRRGEFHSTYRTHHILKLQSETSAFCRRMDRQISTRTLIHFLLQESLMESCLFTALATAAS